MRRQQLTCRTMTDARACVLDHVHISLKSLSGRSLSGRLLRLPVSHTWLPTQAAAGRGRLQLTWRMSTEVRACLTTCASALGFSAAELPSSRSPSESAAYFAAYRSKCWTRQAAACLAHDDRCARVLDQVRISLRLIICRVAQRQVAEWAQQRPYERAEAVFILVFLQDAGHLGRHVAAVLPAGAHMQLSHSTVPAASFASSASSARAHLRAEWQHGLRTAAAAEGSVSLARTLLARGWALRQRNNSFDYRCCQLASIWLQVGLPEPYLWAAMSSTGCGSLLPRGAIFPACILLAQACALLCKCVCVSELVGAA